MARPRIGDLPPENQRILRAYRAAKKQNSDLTEAEFAMTIWGPPKTSRRMAAFMSEKKRAELHSRQMQSRARYFRLVAEGKRTPKILNARADAPRATDLYNVTIGSGNNTKSFNLILAAGTSKIDTFRYLQSREMKKIARQHLQAIAKRYPTEIASLLSSMPTGIRSVRSTSQPEYIFRGARA